MIRFVTVFGLSRCLSARTLSSRDGLPAPQCSQPVRFAFLQAEDNQAALWSSSCSLWPYPSQPASADSWPAALPAAQILTKAVWVHAEEPIANYHGLPYKGMSRSLPLGFSWLDLLGCLGVKHCMLRYLWPGFIPACSLFFKGCLVICVKCGSVLVLSGQISLGNSIHHLSRVRGFKQAMKRSCPD